MDKLHISLSGMKKQYSLFIHLACLRHFVTTESKIGKLA